jgi:hypothetical protein
MNEFQRWEQYAPEAYDGIRQNANDVAEISQNTGWQEFRIKRIKDHLFYRLAPIRLWI